jgi:adenosylcobinamide-phosphate synthase
VAVLAVALDLALGELANRYHPVAWLGRALAWGHRILCVGRPPWLLASGAALTLTMAALAALAGGLVAALAAHLGVLGLALAAVALKATLSLRALGAAARGVAAALARDDLPEARRLVARDLVSRPTATLDRAGVASATIESVAENLADGFVGPLAFFLVFGLPGAMAYRAINTADSMFGYREGRLEHFGKAAARLDDLLNLVPARIAGLSLVLGARPAGARTAAAWATMRRDARVVASPNAGFPMAAMAGALGVVLTKVGAYRLGDGPPPGLGDITRSIRVISWGATIAFTLLALLVAALG